VELFSSQGCNSCPAADALIGELDAMGFSRDDVIPLTYHVTYWDDLGWTDPFASTLHDQRQIAYANSVPMAAKAADETTIEGPYTPQMLVDGAVHFSGSLREVAKAEIESARRAPTPIVMSAEHSVSADRVSVGVESVAADAATLDTDKRKIGLFAVLAQRELETQVPRGENAGKTLKEFSVVRAIAGPKLFRASRENSTHFELQLPEGTGPAAFDVVVFAQDLGGLGILTSVRSSVAG
jgi:hypothetical protein